MRFWVNDRMVEADEAAVSVLDHGFTVADGVFETLAVRQGKAFAVTRHLRRLAASAAGLGLPVPDPDLVRNAIHAVCEANLAEVGEIGRLRVTYTSGAAPLGSERGDDCSTLVVAVASSSPWPPTATIAVVPWTRNERSAVAGLKTTSYAENVVALTLAKRLGATEAVLANTRGELCEGTGSNIVIAKHGRLVTPPLNSGCLAGITRELLIEWCADDCPIEEAPLTLDDLRSADEVLITSSTRDVQPVERIVGDGWDVTLVAPGPLTARAAAIFAVRSPADIDP